MSHRSSDLTNPENQLDPALARSTIAISSYRAISPGPESVGLKTNQFVGDNLDVDGRTRTAEEFLVASRLKAWDRDGALSVADYFADPMITTFGQLDHDTLPEGECIDLPTGQPASMSVNDAILRRRSIRQFTREPVPLPAVATLVRNTAGVTGEADVPLASGGSETYRFRATPSGGGLYPVELHVAAISVPGLAQGVYRYAPRRDQLVAHSDADSLRMLLKAMCVNEDQIGLTGAGLMLLFVAVPWRSMRKYGPRGMRFVLHEVGAMAEHVHLSATSLGLGTTDCASYFDDDANAALGLDGVFQALMHVIIVGLPG